MGGRIIRLKENSYQSLKPFESLNGINKQKSLTSISSDDTNGTNLLVTMKASLAPI